MGAKNALGHFTDAVLAGHEREVRWTMLANVYFHSATEAEMTAKFHAWAKDHGIRITPGPHLGATPRLDQVFYLLVPNRTP